MRTCEIRETLLFDRERGSRHFFQKDYCDFLDYIILAVNKIGMTSSKTILIQYFLYIKYIEYLI